jgi:hypothetical protein
LAASVCGTLLRQTQRWRKRDSTTGSTFKEDSSTANSPLRFSGPGSTGRDRSFLSENDDFELPASQIITLVEQREETWDGKLSGMTALVTG